jgi:hypothetical protein
MNKFVGVRNKQFAFELGAEKSAGGSLRRIVVFT